MLSQPRETILFNPPIPNEGSWMVGLTSLELYNYLHNISGHNNKFELYIFPESKIGGILHENVRDDIEKDLDISDITPTDLQAQIIGPIIIIEYREVSNRMEDGGYMNILEGYTSSILQDFEGYIRTEVDLVEDDIRLVLDKYNSSFITYELQPWIYTFKDLSEVLSRNMMELTTRLILNLMTLA